MNEKMLRALLKELQEGAIDINQALEKLQTLPFEELPFAKIDHHRAIRQGFPETIFCEGKTPQQVAEIIRAMLPHKRNILATRATQKTADAVQKVAPGAEYLPVPRIIQIKQDPPAADPDRIILVITAGTSDIPVAEEAACTAEIMGDKVERVFDVGVAGIHRLFAQHAKIQRANVIIVAAGMEGALASVVGGLVSKPVIALPTSIGYGASFGGLAALLGMLNSCAAGVAVVNIDNGFGAGRLAHIINQMR